MLKKYDIIIIGSGPAGMTAAIYASRYGLSVLMLGAKEGGTISDAHKVCNFPGFPEIEGAKLGEKIKSHAEKEGTTVKMEVVTSIKKNEDGFKIETNLENSYLGRRLILATGTKRRRLNLDNEDKFLGSGISYCATCDGRFFDGKVVGVVGGGNAAVTAALYLSDFAEKVHLFHRRDRLRASEVWKKQIKKKENTQIHYETEIVKLKGEMSLEAIELKDGKEIKLNGLFIEIGSIPETDLAKDLGLGLDEKGYVKVDSEQRTTDKDVWAIGDMTTGSNKFKQAVVAAAEGAVAGQSIHSEAKSNS